MNEFQTEQLGFSWEIQVSYNNVNWQIGLYFYYNKSNYSSYAHHALRINKFTGFALLHNFHRFCFFVLKFYISSVSGWTWHFLLLLFMLFYFLYKRGRIYSVVVHLFSSVYVCIYGDYLICIVWSSRTQKVKDKSHG